MLFWLIVILLLCVYYFLKKPYNYWRQLGVKQGDPWIIVGDNFYSVFKKKSLADLIKYFYDMHPGKRYSGVYRFYLPMLVIRDPELIKDITVKDFDHFTDHRAFVDPDSEPLFAKNLLGLQGQEWKDMRATLTGSFTSSKMKLMFGLVSEAAENFATYFKKQNKDVVEVEMKDLFTRFTIDIIATVAFGVKTNSLNEKNNEFYVMGKEITDIGGSFKRVFRILMLFLFPRVYKLLKLRILDKDVTDFFETLIRDTVKIRREKNIVRSDLINILMEAQDETENMKKAATESDKTRKTRHIHEITIDDITAQAVIFFFAGFDSVSSLMTFLSYELAVNQDVQDKLRAEINETFKEANNGSITYDQLMNMKYFDMVVSEGLRKWPPFASADRICTKPYTIVPKDSDEKPLHIKKGSSVLIPIFGIHRDPQYYPNPQIFDPERFSIENKDNLVPYTLLGFGSGPRSCIGSRFAQMEIKVMFFHLLRDFKLVTTENTQIPVQLSKIFAMNIKPEKGLCLGVQKL